MAGKTVKRLMGLEIDEVSSVDRPAAQHGLIAIAKRAEDTVSYFDSEGNEVDETQLQTGDVVYTDEGDERTYVDPDTYEQLLAEGLVDEDDAELEDADDNELVGAGVGKAAGAGLLERGRQMFSEASYSRAGKPFLGTRNRRLATAGGTAALSGAVAGRASKSMGAQVLEELSKALTEGQRDEIVAKAIDGMRGEVAKAQANAEQAWAVAADLAEQAERGRFIELAKSYDGVPVETDELAEILHTAATTLSKRQLDTLDRVLQAAGSAVATDELGYGGTSSGSDVMDAVQAMALEAVGKADLTQEQAVVALFEANPAAYDEYESDAR